MRKEAGEGVPRPALHQAGCPKLLSRWPVGTGLRRRQQQPLQLHRLTELLSRARCSSPYFLRILAATLQGGRCYCFTLHVWRKDREVAGRLELQWKALARPGRSRFVGAGGGGTRLGPE